MRRVILDESSVLFQWPNSFLPQNNLIKENVALVHIFVVKAVISERNLNNVWGTGALLFCTFPSYVSCVVGCPYEGFIDPKAVAGVSIQSNWVKPEWKRKSIKKAMPCRWRSEAWRKLGIKEVDKGKISTTKRLRSWRFERSPFVVTCRLHYEADVSSVRPSSSLADRITKLKFRALGICPSE